MKEQVQQIKIGELRPFRNHPFRVKDDESLQALCDSIQEYGVLSPLLARPTGEGYEIVSGHRRRSAALKLGLEKLPVLVREMTDDEAIILMVDSNIQRENLLPSEKAFAYRMKLEAMKHQGKSTSCKVCTKLRSDEQIAAEANVSARTVQNYIRLTYLIPKLLEMVDNSVTKDKELMQIAMRPAVELSYLPENEQRMLLDTMELEDCTPSHAQAIKMRQFSKEGKLTEEVICSIMQEEKPNQKEQFRMPKDRINRFFAPGTPAQKIEDTIVKALELYRKRQREMER